MKLHGQAQQVATDILDAFRVGVIPAALATTFLKPPAIDSPIYRWSWRNRFIAVLRGHRDARGFGQWREVGRTVKRGERAFYILGPCTVTAKEADPERGIEEGDARLVGFRGIPVFGYGQTEGEPIEWAEEERRFFDTLPLVEVARSWGLDLRMAGPEAGGNGSFSHNEERAVAITLSVDSPSTWAHELIHAADYRLGTLTRRRGQQLDNEVVAQLGASVLLECLGYTVESDRGGTYRYLEGYARQHDCEVWTVCSQLLDRTCGCVAHILEAAGALSSPTVA